MAVFESQAKSVVGVQAKSADCVEIMIPQLLLLAYVYQEFSQARNNYKNNNTEK